MIVGGGPAGLNAALVLGRARKQVLVIDEGRPRNRVTRESRGFLRRDGIHPAELRRIAKEQISAYPSVHFADDTVITASGEDGSFRIGTAQGMSYRGKKLLFAVGKQDQPLDINGLSDVYGISAFFCPYCDGWELREKELVIIVREAKSLHSVKTLSGWSTRLTLLTDEPNELIDEQRDELKRRQIPLFESPIRRIESTDGDAATDMYQAIAAASMGALAGIAINGELLDEAWNQN